MAWQGWVLLGFAGINVVDIYLYRKLEQLEGFKRNLWPFSGYYLHWKLRDQNEN